jgi:hypothetical protein
MHSTIDAAAPTLPAQGHAPDPSRIFERLLFSHARADALKAAIDLDVFTAIGEGRRTSEAIAERCAASVRGPARCATFWS